MYLLAERFPPLVTPRDCLLHGEGAISLRRRLRHLAPSDRMAEIHQQVFPASLLSQTHRRFFDRTIFGEPSSDPARRVPRLPDGCLSSRIAYCVANQAFDLV